MTHHQGDDDLELIGVLRREHGGDYRAHCGFPACAWTSGDGRSREAAERLLHSHAATVHPAPIRIYRRRPA